ncbi:hypothetical protein FSP39_011032 [Pinctada imbricata]|uniref:Luciferin 4-monooxygenase n=1 Tax=Pinctada imbricata TaxID=66713 RepID=A0AA88XZL1_PINIB|nr:hypothetical protein FSP39_011032 [Pinctada imbricata]
MYTSGCRILRTIIGRRLYFCRCIHKSAFSVDIPDINVAEYIQRDFKKYARKTALIDGVTDRRISFEELEERVSTCRIGLKEAGLTPGDVVCLFAVNAVEFAEIFLSVTGAGATLTMANSQSTTDELAGQLKISNAKIIICTPDCANRALDAAKSISGKEVQVIVIGNAKGCLPYVELLSTGNRTSHIESNKKDVALLPFSSGTTGLPKGVILSHGNLVANLCQIRHDSVLPFKAADDVSVSALPMVHIAGFVVGLLNPLAQGATVVTLPKFEIESFLAAFEKYQGTFALVAPPIINVLAKHPLVEKHDLSSIKCLYSGASTLSKDLTLQMVERLGLNNVRQGYGMSETSPVVTTDPVNHFKYGSIGIPIPNTQIKLICSTTNTEIRLPQETGEVWVKGPQVTQGYLKNVKATAEAITPDGWIKTGDEGYFDSDGHYYIVDRIKDIIKYKGYQVSPAYLESIFLTHPAVADVAVIGVPCGVFGEVPKAYVVPKNKTDSNDLMEYVNGKVAPYKHLRGGIELIDQIPKSPSGKILRRILRENFIRSGAKVQLSTD